ncbi:MAG: RnfABCDGE type electron transport complex subunit B [Pseudomonadota bacterium]
MPLPPVHNSINNSIAKRINMLPAELIDRIDALLPQTQCRLCKTDGCRPYAEAIASGTAINHCVPGGEPTIAAIAALLQVPALPLDPDYGVTPPHRLVALIREDECIGCTKCIQACPVDAIVGAAKLMHTVLVEECTGCNLCVPPCPVDCIDLVPGPDVPMTWHPMPIPAALAEAEALTEAKARADKARQRFLARNQRLATAAEKSAEAAARRKAAKAAVPSAQQPAQSTPEANSSPALTAAERSNLMIAAAMARSQLKKIEKQISALEARGESTDALRAQLPTLQSAAEQAQRALDQAPSS